MNDNKTFEDYRAALAKKRGGELAELAAFVLRWKDDETAPERARETRFEIKREVEKIVGNPETFLRDFGRIETKYKAKFGELETRKKLLEYEREVELAALTTKGTNS